MAKKPIGICIASEGMPNLDFVFADQTVLDRVTNENIHDALMSLTADEEHLLQVSQTMVPDGKVLVEGIVGAMKLDSTVRAKLEAICGLGLETLEFLLEYGETFRGHDLPRDLLKTRSRCFINSTDIVNEAYRQGDRFDYVEGLGRPPVGRLMHHAWNCFPDQTAPFPLIAADYTWARASLARYFGISMTRATLRTIVEALHPEVVAQGKVWSEWKGRGFLHKAVWHIVGPILQDISFPRRPRS